MKNRRFEKLALVIGLCLALSAPAFAEEMASTGSRSGMSSDQNVSTIKEQIKKNTNLSESDLSAIEPELREYSQRNGDPSSITEAAKTASENNCLGPCLSAVLSSMNNAMSKGLSANDAQMIVSSTLKEQVQSRGSDFTQDPNFSSTFNAQVDQKISERSGGTMGTSPGTTEGGSRPYGGGGR